MARNFSGALFVLFGLALPALLSVPAPALSQEKKNDAGKLLGQTPDTGSLPLWSQPSGSARQDLGKAARSFETGVFLAGSPDTSHGTAWAISKKHRLLVTNAHVADLLHEGKGKMFAIPNGTAQIYRVEKVWYHPGVRRYLKGNATLSVRSMDPQDGEIDPRSPDLAVLQLSMEGPDLTVEFPLATAEELASLFAQPAAIFGFPGHDTADWPKLGDKTAATYHDGVVSRITDFEMSPSSPAAELQFVQYTMSTWGGFSGSPVFLPSGRVAAVHNMARTAKAESGVVKSIPHGIRVDCVLEMLVHHGLDDKAPFPIDKTKVAVERWTKPDARSEKARADFAKAEQLVAHAGTLINAKQEFKAGVDKCTQALKLAPNLAAAYQMRSYGVNNFFAFRQQNLNKEDKLTLLQSSLDDAIKFGQLAPSDPSGPAMVAADMNNIGIVKDDESIVRKSITILNALLTGDNVPTKIQAEAHSYRGTAYNFIGDPNAGLREHNEALRLAPHIPVLWENRALHWQENGRHDLARADRAKAKELRLKLIETGMKITEVAEGGAAQKATLEKGDIIVSVSSTRVKTFEDLTKALANAKGTVEIVVVNVQNGQYVKLEITPDNGKIGVAVEQVELE